MPTVNDTLPETLHPVSHLILKINWVADVISTFQQRMRGMASGTPKYAGATV